MHIFLARRFLEFHAPRSSDLPPFTPAYLHLTHPPRKQQYSGPVPLSSVQRMLFILVSSPPYFVVLKRFQAMPGSSFSRSSFVLFSLKQHLLNGHAYPGNQSLELSFDSRSTWPCHSVQFHDPWIILMWWIKWFFKGSYDSGVFFLEFSDFPIYTYCVLPGVWHIYMS